MYGIVYIDKDGSAVSPLYTWQDPPCVAEEPMRHWSSPYKDDFYETLKMQIWQLPAAFIPQKEFVDFSHVPPFGMVWMMRWNIRKLPEKRSGS